MEIWMILRSERVEYPINLTQQQRLHDLKSGARVECVCFKRWKTHRDTWSFTQFSFFFSIVATHTHTSRTSNNNFFGEKQKWSVKGKPSSSPSPVSPSKYIICKLRVKCVGVRLTRPIRPGHKPLALRWWCVVEWKKCFANKNTHTSQQSCVWLCVPRGI